MSILARITQAFLEGLHDNGRGSVDSGSLNTQSYDFLKREGGPVSLLSAAKILKAGYFGVTAVGSEATALDEFAEVVAVGDRDDFWASGVLINNRYVLTAGHVEALGGRARVSIGPNAAKSKLCPGGAEPYPRPEEKYVKHFIRHPGFWNEPFFTHDLAVLKLESGSRTTPGIDLRDLATKEQFDAAKIGRLVGFGTTNKAGTEGYGARRKVDVPIVHKEDLREQARFAEAHSFDPCYEFVAAAPLRDKDACSGDSGGGLFVRVGGRWKLAGMVSRQFGAFDSQCGAGSIYLQLHEYRQCIEAMIDVLDARDGDASAKDRAAVRMTQTCRSKPCSEPAPSVQKPPGGCLGVLWKLFS